MGMKISIDFLHDDGGATTFDNLKHTKTLQWFSVVESLRGAYLFSLNGGPVARISEQTFFIAPAGALQDITHKVDENGVFESQYVFITAMVDDVWLLEEIYDFPVALPGAYCADMHKYITALRALPEQAYCKRMEAGYGILDILLHVGKKKEPRSEGLEHAVRYIRENYQQHISVQSLCSVANMSQAALFRAFQAQLKSTPLSYINAHRLKMAAAMLLDPISSIEKTAFACGFESQAYFSRLFKRTFGMAPGQYRKDQLRTIYSQPLQMENASK